MDSPIDRILCSRGRIFASTASARQTAGWAHNALLDSDETDEDELKFIRKRHFALGKGAWVNFSDLNLVSGVGTTDEGHFAWFKSFHTVNGRFIARRSRGSRLIRNSI